MKMVFHFLNQVGIKKKSSLLISNSCITVFQTLLNKGYLQLAVVYPPTPDIMLKHFFLVQSNAKHKKQHTIDCEFQYPVNVFTKMCICNQ